MPAKQTLSPESTGNSHQAKGSFFPPLWVQPKLSLNEPGDIYELEADAMSERVMQMHAATVSPATFFKPAFSIAQRKCKDCEDEKTKVQRKEGSSPENSGAIGGRRYIDNLGNRGLALSETSRQFFEPRFGQDFAGVRIHTDSAAVKSAASLNALAYTSGNNIVFGEGQFSPGSSEGKRLLAHELTHVVQQKRAPDSLVRRRTARTTYYTTAFSVGPLWEVTLVITGAPPAGTEAFLDFEDACMDGIRGAAQTLGNGSTAVRRRMTVRIPYRRNPDLATIENEAYRQALQSVLPPAPVAPPVVAPPAPLVTAPAPAVTAAPAPVATVSRAGTDFDQFIANVNLLEAAAISDGYSLTQRITAFRKIFYDSSNPASTYAGSTVGGGAFNILIPGAVSTTFPPSWASQPALVAAKAYLNGHQSIQVQPLGNVDTGHVFAGLDAGLHQTSVSIAFGQLHFRSNKEAATFTGDLGSVVVEYIKANPASFRDVAMDLNSSILNAQYTRFASDPDMAGNVDAYSMTLDPGKTVAQNLIDYYTPTTLGVNKRYTNFANSLGLGRLSGGVFAGDTPTFRSSLRDEVFNTALAYAAANGRRVDVTNVISDPGPGIFVPTFWEMYFNISTWVVEKFIQTLVTKVGAE